MDRIKEFKKSDQLFVFWAKHHMRKFVIKRLLSHWLAEEPIRAQSIVLFLNVIKYKL